MLYSLLLNKIRVKLFLVIVIGSLALGSLHTSTYAVTSDQKILSIEDQHKMLTEKKTKPISSKSQIKPQAGSDPVYCDNSVFATQQAQILEDWLLTGQMFILRITEHMIQLLRHIMVRVLPK